jgi:hypothetical protein
LPLVLFPPEQRRFDTRCRPCPPRAKTSVPVHGRKRGRAGVRDIRGAPVFIGLYETPIFAKRGWLRRMENLPADYDSRMSSNRSEPASPIRESCTLCRLTAASNWSGWLGSWTCSGPPPPSQNGRPGTITLSRSAASIARCRPRGERNS